VTEEGKRILALDLGDARIGLALSDPLGITAQPAGIIKASGIDRDVRRVSELVRKHGVDRVVVGYPLHLSGRVGTRAEEANAFAERLREALPGLAVEMWDERLTTAQAEREMIADNVRRRKRRQMVDSLAAVLILQSYLDARSVKMDETPR
jgi:putative Holliday junction resolvase